MITQASPGGGSRSCRVDGAASGRLWRIPLSSADLPSDEPQAMRRVRAMRDPTARDWLQSPLLWLKGKLGHGFSKLLEELVL